MTDPRTSTREKPRCHANRDGDCDWAECPQLKEYQTYCPNAAYWEEIDEEY